MFIFTNMKTLYFFAALTIIFFFSACQKELSNELGGGGPPISNGINDSTVLKTFIWLDTASGGPDTMNITTFEYDNLKRLSKEFTVNYFNNVPDLADISSTTYYYYNGADTVP